MHRIVFLIPGAGPDGSIERARRILALLRLLVKSGLWRNTVEILFVGLGGYSGSDPKPPTALNWECYLIQRFLLEKDIPLEKIQHDKGHSRTTFQNIDQAVKQGLIRREDQLIVCCAPVQQYPIDEALELCGFSRAAYVFVRGDYSALHAAFYRIPRLLAFGSLRRAIVVETPLVWFFRELRRANDAVATLRKGAAQ